MSLSSRPRIFAHRGLAVEAPENTLLAFAEAVALGVDDIETDVQVSLDGVAIVCHDSDLRRIAGREARVERLTLSELRRVDLGYGQGLCSLAEALDSFTETRFNIDIKTAAAVLPTVRAIQSNRASNRVLVTSFSESRRRAAVAQLPGVATSASASLFVQALLAAKAGARGMLKRVLRGITAVQVPESALGMRVTTDRVIGHFHEAGVEVHVWTINSPQRMLELLELGVDGIVTDRADLALGVIDSWQRSIHP